MANADAILGDIPIPTLLRVTDYIDNAIRYWRERRDQFAVGHPEHTMAVHYVDAFQSVRSSMLGEILPGPARGA